MTFKNDILCDLWVDHLVASVAPVVRRATKIQGAYIYA